MRVLGLESGYFLGPFLGPSAAEKCNGTGACRKRAGRGTMCPSCMATLEENYSTRGRVRTVWQRQVIEKPD
ncbi:MAG: hypothetical protein ACT4QB_20180 [Gammaproteobacteria bacterium]